VALSSAAKSVLAELPHIEGCDFVFTRDGRKPMSGFSRAKETIDGASGVQNWTLHDLRRTRALAAEPRWRRCRHCRTLHHARHSRRACDI
jgi:hypothetical protein